MPDKVTNGSVNEGSSSPQPVKRGRGRPKKVKPEKGISNEGVEKIVMNNPTQATQINKDEFEMVSINQIQKKWTNVFNKYNSVMSPNDISIIANMVSNYTRNSPFLNNQRVKSIIAEGKKISANEIDKYIEDPVNNERSLQEVSWALYYQSMIYMYLTRVDRETPRFNYFVIPEDITPEDLKKESYKKEKKKVEQALKLLNPKVTFKDYTMQLQNEGKISLLPRVSYDDKEVFFFCFNKLPGQFVKIVGFGSKQHFVIMLDMSMFLNPMYDVGQFPPFIGEKWEEMLTRGIVQDTGKGYQFNPKAEIDKEDILECDGDTWFYWYRIPQDMVFTFSADGSHPLTIPDASGILSDIGDLNSYKLAQQTALSNAITSVLTAEVPYADGAQPGRDSTKTSTETVLGFTDLFEQKVGKSVMGFFAPFENFKLLSLAEDIEPATTIVSRRIQDVVNTSGLSGVINLSDRPSVATVKSSQLIQEAKSRYIVQQFENAVNRILNESFDFKYKWKVSFWGYCWTEENELKLMKEMILSGCKELLPRFLSAYNLTIEDYSVIHSMMDALDIKIIKDELIYSLEEGRKTQIEALGVKNAVQLGDTTKNSVGRPKMDDNDVENDSTSASKDQGSDVSENKSVYSGKLKEFMDEYITTDMNEDEILEVLSQEVENLI